MYSVTMLKFAPKLILWPLITILLLSACSIADNRNLSGSAAEQALNQVIDKSVETMKKEGGSETVQVTSGQFAIIYNPEAEAGKKVVTANLSDKTSPSFAQESSIALFSLKQLLSAPELKESSITLTDNIFTVEGDAFVMNLRVRDDLIITTTLEGLATGIQDKQVIMTTYGLTDEAIAIYESAK